MFPGTFSTLTAFPPSSLDKSVWEDMSQCLLPSRPHSRSVSPGEAWLGPLYVPPLGDLARSRQATYSRLSGGNPGLAIGAGRRAGGLVLKSGSAVLSLADSTPKFSTQISTSQGQVCDLLGNQVQATAPLWAPASPHGKDHECSHGGESLAMSGCTGSMATVLTPPVPCKYWSRWTQKQPGKSYQETDPCAKAKKRLPKRQVQHGPTLVYLQQV